MGNCVRICAAFSALLVLAMSGPAFAIPIVLSGVAVGLHTEINAPGGSFAQTFDGQTVVGDTGIAGTPTNPLTLAPSSDLTVIFWDPTVTPPSNAILSGPSFQSPLSILLDANADSITWTMGSGNPPSSVDVDFFDASGGLLQSLNQPILAGNNVYLFGGFGSFRGLTISNNDDQHGLQLQNFDYSAVPEPSAWVLLGLAGVALLCRSRMIS
jgi:hypothetical protein